MTANKMTWCVTGAAGLVVGMIAMANSQTRAPATARVPQPPVEYPQPPSRTVPNPYAPPSPSPFPAGPRPTGYAPAAPTPAPPTPATIVPATPIAPATPAIRPVPAPIGSWRREIGPMQVELEGTPKTLAGTVHFPVEDGGNITMDVEFLIEYSTTSDGLLYGVIQSTDLKIPNIPGELDEILELKVAATKLIDMPVSARVRVDGDVLTIKSFHLGIPLDASILEGLDGDGLKLIQAMFVGRYDRSTPNAT